jgi:Flp pilus assembly protein TadG
MTNTIETATNPHDNRQRFRARVSHSPLTGETGQGLIELALTLPIFLLLLVGAAEFARFAWASIEVANAAQAGVQYGAQSNITASDDAGIQTAALNDGTNLTGMTATPTHWCACSSAASTAITCSTALSNCAATIIEYVQVNTTATVRPLYRWAGLLPTSFTANGSAVMEVEQ